MIIKSTLTDIDNVANMIAKNIKKGQLITLSGDLGAGKTTLTARVLKMLGISQIVNSPTFAIVKTYEAKDIEILHIDAYRLSSADTVETGIEDMIYDRDNRIIFIEWWENIADMLPKADMHIDIRYDGEDSRIYNIKEN